MVRLLAFTTFTLCATNIPYIFIPVFVSKFTTINIPLNEEFNRTLPICIVTVKGCCMTNILKIPQNLGVANMLELLLKGAMVRLPNSTPGAPKACWSVV